MNAIAVPATRFPGVFALLAITGGLGLAGATYVKPVARSQVSRAVAISAIAAALFAIVLSLSPQCLGGPYSTISPELNRIWLSRVQEVKPPFSIAFQQLGFFCTTYVYPLVGVVMSVVAVFLVERRNCFRMLIVLAFATITLAVTTLEVRGAPFANLTALPGLAVTIHCLSRRWIKLELWRILAMVVALAMLSDAAFGFFSVYALVGINRVQTMDRAHRATLTRLGKDSTTQLVHLPKGQVASLIPMAPTLLIYTRDSVMAGSYNRDGAAILDLYKLFTEPSSASLSIVRQYGTDYIMTCRAVGDYRYYIKQGGPSGLLSQLANGHVPPWLVALPPTGPENMVRVYKVVPDRSGM